MKNNKFKLFYHIRRHAGLYAVALLSLVIGTTLSMIMPQVTMHIVDDVIVGGNTDKLPPLLIAYLCLGAGRMVLQFSKEFTFDWLSATITTLLRRDLFVHIQNLDTSFFDKTNTGEVMSRLKDDIDKIWEALSFISMLLIEVAIHTVLILYCMFRLNAYMAIIPLLAIIISGCLAMYLDKKVGPIYGAISDADADLNTVAEENIAGVRTVKAFARESYEIEKFNRQNDNFCELNIKQSKTFARYYPYFSFAGRVVPLLVILVGGYIFATQKEEIVTLGIISAFISYANNIIWPMEMLGWLTNMFSSAVASYKKIKKIYDEAATINDPEEPVVLPTITGHITFDHVGFHKEDLHEIINDVSFDVPAGHTLGIMGTTGAGKTSIVSLLTRLYDVTSGSIKIDDTDIRDMTIDQVRGSVSLVMQDVFLFSDTISENIKMGKKHTVSDKLIKQSSKFAGASEFIEKMDKQYETVIGERGVGLSGGQKQRISIARAFAKELPILIMDDSTSALDMETERDIQKRLTELTGMTKLIIAHRISSVKNADEIIVLDNGSIAERGTHEQLLKKHGLYYETYVSQYGNPDEKEAI